MKFVIALCFFLAVAYTVSAEESEETEIKNLELVAPEQARACAQTKELCTRDDDCSCCGKWDMCDCNHPNEPGVCRCKYAMIYTRTKKALLC